jgi:hypothetical protein
VQGGGCEGAHRASTDDEHPLVGDRPEQQLGAAQRSIDERRADAVDAGL